jgi:hypothetical protein
VNQQVNGGQWNLLGTFPFAAGTAGNVELSDGADGVVIADAVMFRLVDNDVDNLDPEATCSWSSGNAPTQQYGSDFQYDNAPGGGNTCTWIPDVACTGYYNVYAWWVAYTNRASDAPYTITYDGGSETVDVSQQVNGGQWNLLGTYPFVAGTSGSIVLTDYANGVVIADAVLLESVEAPPPVVATTVTVDNDDPEASLMWSSGSTPTQQYGSDFQYDNAPGGADTATWTPDIAVAGNYEVYAWWVAWTNRATDAPYTINYNGGSETVDVDQQVNGGQWNLLGTYPFVAGTSGSVLLTDDANGVVIADSIGFVLQP